jgi:multiple sugar transport system substrate-binding protein
MLLATAATGLAAGPLGMGRAFAQAGQPIHFTAWSAAVDQVRSHISSFESETGIKVAYENYPGAQFRATLVNKFVTGAPLDVMWMNDAWTPEFVNAGWIVPIDEYADLTKYNSDIEAYCLDSLTYDGRQYGLVYYTDFMAFFYNADILQQAGITKPPQTWDEVVEQSLTIKQKGLSEYPLIIPLAADAWLVEFVSSIVFSFGGRFIGADGMPVMQAPDGGAVAALKWMQAAMHEHEVMSKGAPETQEINALKAFGAGAHAFAVLPRYRIKPLNDPSQSQVPGKVRLALMPKGGAKGTNETCGWVRYYGMTPAARKDEAKAANCLKFIEWFGGKAGGEYVFQKMLMLDLGVPFCTKPLNADPDVRKFYKDYIGGTEIVGAQSVLAVKKDVIAPWFGEWNEVNNTSWQRAFLRQVSAEQALATSADEWTRLKKSY